VEKATVANARTGSPAGFFEIEQQDDTLILVPTENMEEWYYQRIETGAREVLERLNGTAIKNLVLDFGKTLSFGSTALGIFVKLWKRVRMRHGRMALCNLSDHEKKILEITKLDDLWLICASRSEALAAVAGG
jgi:anti-sigma B factor antagonist